MKSNASIERAVSLTLASCVLALSLSIGTAHAQESVSASDAENGNLWFVELAGKPVADGAGLAAVRNEKAAFRRAAAAAGAQFTERRSFDVLFNGFTVEASAANRVKLARLAGVKALYPVETIAAPEPGRQSAISPDLVAAINTTGASAAQTAGYSGSGIKVGIIDTGIDIDHPAFGGGGVPGGTSFPSARVAYGYDFVGDDYDAGSTGGALVPVPDPNPDDCGGHGSHVSGIVGGNGGGIRGVAPSVTFGAYRVFGCVGSTSSEIIVEALERAYADGMQVVNQSLGSGRQWPQYPTAQATSRLAAKGVVMVASIGNNGPGGSSPDALFAAGAPGVGANVIGVASYDNAQQSFTVNSLPYGFNTATGAPAAPVAGSLPMLKTGTTTSTTDACSPLVAGSLTGTAVLIRRGGCAFAAKSANAQAAGAAAVVLYNNAAGALSPTVAGGGITIPVVAITAAQGATLDGLIAAGPTTLNWTSTYVNWPSGTGGLISGFSSFGLAADLTLKPNLGAPGGGILSAYPLEDGGSAVLSGTSMSSPHVAGGVALIMQARPDIGWSQMLRRLQNSADPKNWSGNPALGFLDHSHRQGAGMLDIMGTINSKTVVTPSQLSVGESDSGAKTFTIRVDRDSRSSTVTYDISHVPALVTGPNTQTGASYAISGVFDAPANVTFSVPSVTVAKQGRATFDVTIDANSDPALPERSIYGGYIVLTPRDGSAVYSVPFSGFKGDYQTTQVLTPTANGFPWLAQLEGGFYQNRNATGATFTMVGDDIPLFLLHLDHLSRRIRLEAFDAVTGKPWNKVSDDEFVTRNSTPGGFFEFAWDGTTFFRKGPDARPVPNGQYVVKVSVLKALGDESNPAHWETWTSAVITIARP